MERERSTRIVPGKQNGGDAHWTSASVDRISTPTVEAEVQACTCIAEPQLRFRRVRWTQDELVNTCKKRCASLFAPSRLSKSYKLVLIWQPSPEHQLQVRGK